MHYLLLALFITFLLYLFLTLPSLRRHPDRKLLEGMQIAHRGLHSLDDETPENSLSAIKKAIAKGYAIEIDIHLTKDKQIVVFHDSSTLRMCGEDNIIEKMTLDEIKALHLKNTAEQIPTLNEVLDVVGGRVPLMIEFKAEGVKSSELCENANEILKAYDGKYFIQSFFPQVLYWYRKNRPDICRGQLSSGKIGKLFYHKLAERLLFNFLSRPDFLSYEQLYADRLSKKWVTLLGAFPVGWTFQSQEDIENRKKQFKTFIFEAFIPNK